MYKPISTAVLSILLGVALGSETAQAFFRRYHGAGCVPVTSALPVSYSDSNGLVNNNSSAAVFFCPIVSDVGSLTDSLPHERANVTVHGNKGSFGTDSVTTCIKSWSVNSFWCTLDTTRSAAGPWGMSPLTDPWWTDTGSTNFPYVKVVLQSGSSIYGLFTTD